MTGRYARQELFIGAAAQAAIGQATAVVVGCGALGGLSAGLLARAGVGHLRLVDRDYVEATNLHRQVLFTEADVASATPKAVAAAAHLQAANSTITIEAVVADFTSGNATHLLRGATVIVDGLDNFEGRFLLNDVAVRDGVPWVYGAAVAAYGATLTVLPGGPCLRCLHDEAPPAGSSATCDTVGVLAPVATTIASIQAAEALKICARRRDLVTPRLLALDLWHGGVQEVQVGRRPDCPCCVARRFDHLQGAAPAAVLCGRDAVQLAGGGAVDLDAVAGRLPGLVVRNAYLVRAQVEGHELTVFVDGRVVVGGTREPTVARGLAARYVGT